MFENDGELTTEEETPGELLTTEISEQQPEGESPLEDQEPEESIDDSERQSGYLRDADYRKKTMALAEERKAFEEQKKSIEENASRWSMFQKDENYRQAVISMVNGASAQAPTQTVNPEGSSPDLSQWDPEHLEIVKHVTRQVIEEMVMPKLQQGEEALRGIHAKEVRKMWNGLQKSHPEAKGYENKIVSYLQANPTVSDLEEAFFAVAGKDLLSKRQVIAKKQDSEARKDAQVTQTTISSGATTPKKKESLADIVRDVMERQRA